MRFKLVTGNVPSVPEFLGPVLDCPTQAKTRLEWAARGDYKIYPQEFLESQIQTLSNYADNVLIPYLDRERNRSLVQEIFF